MERVTENVVRVGERRDRPAAELAGSAPIKPPALPEHSTIAVVAPAGPTLGREAVEAAGR